MVRNELRATAREKFGPEPAFVYFLVLPYCVRPLINARFQISDGYEQRSEIGEPEQDNLSYDFYAFSQFRFENLHSSALNDWQVANATLPICFTIPPVAKAALFEKNIWIFPPENNQPNLMINDFDPQGMLIIIRSKDETFRISDQRKSEKTTTEPQENKNSSNISLHLNFPSLVEKNIIMFSKKSLLFAFIFLIIQLFATVISLPATAETNSSSLPSCPPPCMYRLEGVCHRLKGCHFGRNHSHNF
ncbi:hypothetical protein HUJ04_000933 [Dendroctonus ponderosae]|nr:hypothetical protein HUJ04_000933 [Dendroctonus ponderosae]